MPINYIFKLAKNGAKKCFKFDWGSKNENHS